MSLVRWDPLAELAEMSRGVSRLLDGFQDGAVEWFPVDVFETPDAFVIHAALPGADERSIQVQYEHDALTVRANRYSVAPADAKPVLREIANGEFTRSFRFNTPVDVDKAEASYANGVLTVRLPKREEARARIIPVRDEPPAGEGRQ